MTIGSWPPLAIKCDGGCPFVERDLVLREECVGCQGRPTSGQRTLDKGHFLCWEGEPAGYVFAVVSGVLKETSMQPDGRIQVVRFLQQGDLCGLDALGGGHYRTSVEALAPSRVCAVAVSELDSSVTSHPERACALNRALGEQFQQLRENILLLGSPSAEERVEGFLRNFYDRSEHAAWVRLPITRQEMAELLGLSLSTVSRSVQALARNGAIEVRGRLFRFSQQRDP